MWLLPSSLLQDVASSGCNGRLSTCAFYINMQLEDLQNNLLQPEVATDLGTIYKREVGIVVQNESRTILKHQTSLVRHAHTCSILFEKLTQKRKVVIYQTLVLICCLYSNVFIKKTIEVPSYTCPLIIGKVSPNT